MLFTRISARYKMLRNCSEKKKILSPTETLCLIYLRLHNKFFAMF